MASDPRKPNERAFRAQSVHSTERKGMDGVLLQAADVRNIEGIGRPKTFGQYVVDGRMRIFVGEPPKAMLDDNLILVQDMRGRPWPDSAQDRLGRKPRAQHLARLDGAWPDEKEVASQRWAAAKYDATPCGDATHPSGCTKGRHLSVAKLKRDGMRPQDIERHMAGTLYSADVPDPESLLSPIVAAG